MKKESTHETQPDTTREKENISKKQWKKPKLNELKTEQTEGPVTPSSGDGGAGRGPS